MTSFGSLATCAWISIRLAKRRLSWHRASPFSSVENHFVLKKNAQTKIYHLPISSAPSPVRYVLKPPTWAAPITLVNPLKAEARWLPAAPIALRRTLYVGSL